MNKLLAKVVLRFPWLTILAVSGLTVFFGYKARTVKLYFDPDDTLPQNHPYILLKDKVEEYFGGNNTTVVGVHVKEGTIFNPTTLAKVKRITEKILDMDGVIPSQVVSIAAKKVKDIHGTEEGMDVRKMMEEVPQTPQGLERLRAAVFSNPMYVGTIVSKDEKTAAILSDFTEDTYNVSIYKHMLEITEPEKDANTNIYIGGITAHMYWLDYYSRQMPLFFVTALVVILLLLFAAFRNLRGMFLPLLSSLMSVVWALGIMGLIRFPLDAFNVMAPILILGVGSSHSIQIISRFYEEFLKTKNREQAVHTMLSGISKAALTAVATDAAGFATLIIFPLRSIRGFGLITGFGLLSILITSLTFIPACLAVLPAPRRALQTSSGGILTKILTSLSKMFLGKKHALLVVILGIVVVGSLMGTFRIVAESNFTTIFKKESRLRRDDRALNQALAGTTTFFVLVEGTKQDTIKEPKILKAMDGLQQFLEQKPYVGDTWSIVDFLKQMNKAMHADNPAYRVLPENRNLIFQYLLLYSMGGDPEDFDNVVDYEYRMAVVEAFLHDYSTATAKRLITETKKYVREHFPRDYNIGIAAGSSAVSAALNEVMIRGQIWNIIQVSLVVFLICAVIFRSIIGGLFTLIPLVFAVLINFGVMGWAGIWLSIGTATIAAMGIGIGVDYAIYFLSRFRQEWHQTADINLSLIRTMTTSGKAIVFTALSIACGYCTLLFSNIIYHIHIGLLVALIMVSSLLGAITLLPALIVWIRPKFIFGEKTFKTKP